jgi:hypothetical protein
MQFINGSVVTFDKPPTDIDIEEVWDRIMNEKMGKLVKEKYPVYQEPKSTSGKFDFDSWGVFTDESLGVQTFKKYPLY